MSLARFLKDHGKAMRLGDETDHQQRMQEAYETVRDKWLADKDYLAIVKAIVGNWTSGNCVEFMAPVTRALLSANELDLHRNLWTRTIKRQVQDFFREYSFIRAQKLGFHDIYTTDSTGFDEFARGAYDDHRAAAAFLLRRLISDVRRWRKELESANLSTNDAERIEQSLSLLKMPRIEVDSLPPNPSFKRAAHGKPWAAA